MISFLYCFIIIILFTAVVLTIIYLRIQYNTWSCFKENTEIYVRIDFTITLVYLVKLLCALCYPHFLILYRKCKYIIICVPTIIISIRIFIRKDYTNNMQYCTLYNVFPVENMQIWWSRRTSGLAYANTKQLDRRT